MDSLSLNFPQVPHNDLASKLSPREHFMLNLETMSNTSSNNPPHPEHHSRSPSGTGSSLKRQQTASFKIKKDPDFQIFSEDLEVEQDSVASNALKSIKSKPRLFDFLLAPSTPSGSSSSSSNHNNNNNVNTHLNFMAPAISSLNSSTTSSSNGGGGLGSGVGSGKSLVYPGTMNSNNNNNATGNKQSKRFSTTDDVSVLKSVISLAEASSSTVVPSSSGHIFKTIQKEKVLMHHSGDHNQQQHHDIHHENEEQKSTHTIHHSSLHTSRNNSALSSPIIKSPPLSTISTPTPITSTVNNNTPSSLITPSAIAAALTLKTVLMHDEISNEIVTDKHGINHIVFTETKWTSSSSAFTKGLRINEDSNSRASTPTKSELINSQASVNTTTSGNNNVTTATNPFKRIGDLISTKVLSGIATGAADGTDGNEQRPSPQSLPPPTPVVVEVPKVEGREIKQDHELYALTYGMMLGIRVMLKRVEIELREQRLTKSKEKMLKLATSSYNTQGRVGSKHAHHQINNNSDSSKNYDRLPVPMIDVPSSSRSNTSNAVNSSSSGDSGMTVEVFTATSANINNQLPPFTTIEEKEDENDDDDDDSFHEVKINIDDDDDDVFDADNINNINNNSNDDDDENMGIVIELNHSDYIEDVELEFPPEGSLLKAVASSSKFLSSITNTGTKSATTTTPVAPVSSSAPSSSSTSLVRQSLFSKLSLSRSIRNFPVALTTTNSSKVISSSSSSPPQPSTISSFPTPPPPLTVSIPTKAVTPPHKLPQTFKFKDYMPKPFRVIRGLAGIDESEYMRSIAGDFNYIEFIANSKSGQFFFYSHDGKYMIKTQTQEESRFLRKIMPVYVDHIIKFPNSLLVRFYGMHRVKMDFLQSQSTSNTIHFVIMSSVFYTEKPIHIKYDLKGSTIGRITKIKDCDVGAVQKDLNLVQSGRKFHLTEKHMKLFKATIERDAAFLALLNIMDYSLLVGIHEDPNLITTTTTNQHQTVTGGGTERERSFSQISALTTNTTTTATAHVVATSSITGDVSTTNNLNIINDKNYNNIMNSSSNKSNVFQSYHGGIRSSQDVGEIYFLGIIDILQTYNFHKKGETIIKSVITLGGKSKEISAVPPRFYARRFVKFLLKHTNYYELIAQQQQSSKKKSKRIAASITPRKNNTAALTSNIINNHNKSLQKEKEESLMEFLQSSSGRIRNNTIATEHQKYTAENSDFTNNNRISNNNNDIDAGDNTSNTTSTAAATVITGADTLVIGVSTGSTTSAHSHNNNTNNYYYNSTSRNSNNNSNSANNSNSNSSTNNSTNSSSNRIINSTSNSANSSNNPLSLQYKRKHSDATRPSFDGHLVANFNPLSPKVSARQSESSTTSSSAAAVITSSRVAAAAIVSSAATTATTASALETVVNSTTTTNTVTNNNEANTTGVPAEDGTATEEAVMMSTSTDSKENYYSGSVGSEDSTTSTTSNSNYSTTLTLMTVMTDSKQNSFRNSESGNNGNITNGHNNNNPIFLSARTAAAGEYTEGGNNSNNNRTTPPLLETVTENDSCSSVDQQSVSSQNNNHSHNKQQQQPLFSKAYGHPTTAAAETGKTTGTNVLTSDTKPNGIIKTADISSSAATSTEKSKNIVSPVATKTPVTTASTSNNDRKSNLDTRTSFWKRVF